MPGTDRGPQSQCIVTLWDTCQVSTWADHSLVIMHAGRWSWRLGPAGRKLAMYGIHVVSFAVAVLVASCVMMSWGLTITCSHACEKVFGLASRAKGA